MKEAPMFARLSRLFRAWVGFFISLGEDPEIMLQDAIEEMRMTMPKLNSVLVATRATVIRLEEERDALLRQERTLTAGIQAALRDGSAEARSVAEGDALTLQQLRMDLASTQEQLAAAAKAHEGAQVSVESLKSKLKEKIEVSQRALKERQKAQTLKVAADAIVELQSYGVASTADKFLEQIKQEVAESKAAVEVATGGIDTQSIARERTARKIKAAGILQEFEREMGISAPPTAAGTTVTPSVGSRVPEKPGS
jgi:phage shock protein A